MLRHYSTEAVKASKQVAQLPIVAGLILSRTPIVTPEPSAFEKAYYHYQDQLERRLMWTFPRFYYYKKGSIAERKFNDAQRGPPSKQPGVWFPRGDPDILFGRERRAQQDVVLAKDDNSSDSLLPGSSENDDSMSRPISFNSRTTPHEDNTHELARKLDRTLYLLTKQNGKWLFPAYSLKEGEPLHVATERGLREQGGENINTWVVSNTPALFLKQGDVSSFFIKSHILHGKFVPSGVEDFGWFTKEEIKELVDGKYFEELSPVLNKQ